MSSGMLDGVTVLDLSAVGPATRAARWLADYGATVVKVEPVVSQRSGAAAPPFHAYGAGRDFKRVRIDLKSAEGRDAFLALADSSDVVLESFRPGVVARLGIDYDVIRDRNPAVVYCATTGYGQSGKRSGWAGHDLNYLAAGGFLDYSGRTADGAPALPGTTVADTAAGGMHAVIAVLAALIARGRTGEGTYLDVSVHDGVLALMSLQLDAFLATGLQAGPGHGVLHGQYACYAPYIAGDGHWLTVAAIEHKFWVNLCRALDLPQWADRQLDVAVQAEIRADLARAFAGRSRDEWVSLLAGADTCVAPVASISEIAADAELADRGVIGRAHHPVHGTFRQLMPTFAGTGRPEGVVRLAADDHTDTDALLTRAGRTAAELNDLRERGIIG